jgi:hypothetical protein
LPVEVVAETLLVELVLEQVVVLEDTAIQFLVNLQVAGEQPNLH